MTPLDALRAVYAKGVKCFECKYRVREFNPDSRSHERWCTLIDNPWRDPEDCPGVEDELARSEDATR